MWVLLKPVYVTLKMLVNSCEIRSQLHTWRKTLFNGLYDKSCFCSRFSVFPPFLLLPSVHLYVFLFRHCQTVVITWESPLTTFWVSKKSVSLFTGPLQHSVYPIQCQNGGEQIFFLYLELLPYTSQYTYSHNPMIIIIIFFNLVCVKCSDK